MSAEIYWSYPMTADILNVYDVSFVSEEEAQQVQEKMDALRIRCSVLNLSSLDVLQRLEQGLEASSRCTSSQEDLHLWLGRIERELLGAAGAQTHAGDAVLCAAERQRVRLPLNPTTNQSDDLALLLTINQWIVTSAGACSKSPEMTSLRRAKLN